MIGVTLSVFQRDLRRMTLETPKDALLSQGSWEIRQWARMHFLRMREP